MGKWQRVLLVLAVLAAGAYWFVAIPAQSTPNGSQSASRFEPGPYQVVSEDFEGVDTARPTRAYDEFPGSPSRALKGTLWRPAGRQLPGPLLVYSHGFMSFHQEGLYLARFLASHGYTVIAVDYPLTSFFAPGRPLISDVVNQPGDISFLIDVMLTRNADPADALHGTIDPGKIAVAGVSLGGLTSTLAGFHHKLRDPRIAAAISIAGPGSIFTADFFSGRELPYLMVYGDGDAIVPYRQNAAPVAQMYPGGVLVTLKGASHAGFAQPASTVMRYIANPDGVGCRAVRGTLHFEGGRLTDVLPGLGAEDGIDPRRVTEPCASALPATAMKASRQHMFTTLAVHAFLESVFADDAELRDAARLYLLSTLPAENRSEVYVSQQGLAAT